MLGHAVAFPHPRRCYFVHKRTCHGMSLRATIRIDRVSLAEELELAATAVGCGDADCIEVLAHARSVEGGTLFAH